MATSFGGTSLVPTYALLIGSILWPSLTGCLNTDFSSASGGASQSRAEEQPQNQPGPNQSPVPYQHSGTPIDESRRQESFVATALKGGTPVDIIFVVDTSGSMGTEKTMLEQNIAAFVQTFLQQNAQINYQLFMIGSGFAFPANLANAKVAIINQTVASNDALWIAANFLKGLYPSSLTLRPSSIKELVFVTDDNAVARANSLDAQGFVAEFGNAGERIGKVRINGFLGVPGGDRTPAWCTIVQDGTEYIKLRDMAQFGGLIQNLCEPQWKNLFDNLGAQLSGSAKQIRYVLKGTPVPASIQVSVNGVAVDPSRWTYVPADKTILFADEQVAPLEGATVDISYGSQI